MLCVLVVMFAVGARLGTYHAQQRQVKPMAETTAWESDPAPSDSVPLAEPSTVLFLFAAALTLIVTWTSVPAQADLQVPVPLGFSPHHSVRPPPAV